MSENIKNTIPTSKETRRVNITRKKTKKVLTHECIPDKNIITEFPGKDPANYLNLMPYVLAVLKERREKTGKEGGKDIYGNATEYWFMDNINCQRCNAKNWTKCAGGTPAFDFECNNCKVVYSIKGGHTDYFKKTYKGLKVHACGRYSPLINAHAKKILDWVLIYYDKVNNNVKSVYYIPHEKINSDKCIIARTPLGLNTKNPGWKGSKIKFSGNIFKRII